MIKFLINSPFRKWPLLGSSSFHRYRPRQPQKSLTTAKTIKVCKFPLIDMKFYLSIKITELGVDVSK